MTISASAYVLCAGLDAYLTAMGLQGNIALEGNPIIKAMMAQFGIVAGMVLEKGIVLALAVAIAISAYRGIAKDADWVYVLALTRATKKWMQRKKRYWVAFVPLYLIALAQGLAALSWLYLLIAQDPH